MGLLLAVAAALVLTLLPPVQANSAAQPLPFAQDWSNTALLAANDDWLGVPGIVGYTGSGLTELTGADPQTITAGSPGAADVIVNQRGPAVLTAGGLAEFELPDPTVALQGSGTADAPYLLISLDTTGQSLIAVTYTLRDLDGSADDAVTPVALQYRVGSTGDFINLPEAFVPDATDGPYLGGRKTVVWANLPAAAENQSLVQLRIITANAAGYDEWVGIDDIRVLQGSANLPYVQSVTPEFNAFEVPVDASFTLHFNEPVTINPDEPGFSFDCYTRLSIYAVEVSDPGMPSTEHIIRAYEPLPLGDFCTLTVPYTAVQAETGESPLYDFSTRFFTAGCGNTNTTIHDITGPGGTLGESYVIEGVVTAYTPGLEGYFIQSDAPDADPSTSEGIFIYDPGRMVTKGDKIRLYGNYQLYNSPAGSLGQHYQEKEILLEAGIGQCGAGISIEPAVLDLPLSGGTLESYENMLVTIPEPLTVQQTYFLGRFGQLTLGADGRVFHPNAGQGGTDAEALARTLVLDDGTHVQNPNPVPYYAADGALRAGDTVSGLTGVLDRGRINAARTDSPDFTAGYPNIFYRIHPTIPPVFTPANPRGPAPEVGGELWVAGFNLHNYFTTLDDTPYPLASPYDSVNTPRGADSAAELQRQTDKLAVALAALDADVVGLVEVESWPDAAAVENLVAALNAIAGAGTYAAVPDPAGFPYPQKAPAVGGDFIKAALIYQPASVTPVGPSLMDNDSVYSRVPVAQTFQVNADGEVFTVVVNHFKSRGDCPTDSGDPNRDTGQGCWNALRTQQATQLLTFVTELQTTSADQDVLVVGDLNAYAAEDPVAALTAGGLTDLDAALIPAAQQYSFIYDGQSGSIDHALATESLTAQTAGTAFWYINADEPPILDYNIEFNPVGLYAANPYRSSDHDPLLVGLDLYTPHPSITTDDLPAVLQTGQLIEFHLRAQNPADSAPLAQAIFHYRISGAAVADIDLFEYYDSASGWLPMPMLQDGPDVTGSFGPAEGFLMPAGYDQTSAFRIRFDRPGVHTVTVTLEDLAAEPPQTRAALTREIEVQVRIYFPLIGR